MTSLISKLRSGSFPRLARWGLQLAIAIIVPGGLVALTLFWWHARLAHSR